jgi:hypothetical protein
MSTNNANQVPPSGGAKKGMSRTLLSSMTSEDIFKVMDLNASASVEKYIPKQGRGNVGLVPGHIRGCSNNPMRVITAIEHFRRIGEARQNVESGNWTAMSANTKKVYKKRIAQLVVIRGDLNLGIETWKAVTAVVDGVFVENENDLPAPPEPPATSSASAMIDTPAPGVSNGMAVSAAELTASANEESQDPNAHAGLGPMQALRDAKEADAKPRPGQDKKRNVGSFAQRVGQQNDSLATTCMVNAFRSVAIACDTSHYPGLVEGQPRHTIICIAVNQIADPRPQGGKTKASDIVRLKTQVTIVGRDKESVEWALGEAMQVSKHGESPTHERIDLFHDKESKMVQTTIDRFLKEKKQARQRPSKIPRSSN